MKYENLSGNANDFLSLKDFQAFYWYNWYYG